MVDLLRRPSFALLWCAGLISLIGDWVLIAALPYAMYKLTGSPLASGAIWVAYYLPGLVVGPVGGVFADRWDRKRLMVAVSLLQAGALLPLLLVRSAASVWIAYLAVFAMSALAQFFIPAHHALLPRLVGEERLQEANALASLTDNLARIIGPALGGVAVATIGLAGAALLDSVSFLLCAALIAPIIVPSTPRRVPAARSHRAIRQPLRAIWQDGLNGLRVVRQSDVLSAIFVVAGLAALADSIATALLVPFLAAVPGSGARALGTLFTVRGISGLLGGFVVGWIGTRLPPARILGVSLIAIGALFVIVVHLHSLALILALFFVGGPCAIGWLTSQQTLLQTGAPDAYRGRVFGAYSAVGGLALVAGAGLGSTLGAAVGVVPLLTGSAAMFILAGLLALRLLGEARSATTRTEVCEPISLDRPRYNNLGGTHETP